MCVKARLKSRRYMMNGSCKESRLRHCPYHDSNEDKSMQTTEV